ncbi:hypothetical protein N007_15595 [Alicyclobacillus acidoterrestris ATCC 49025]|nr:hypothetical protein N007_15595 [Alicyclobacillus acidoterrestris ATCC 49025]
MSSITDAIRFIIPENRPEWQGGLGRIDKQKNFFVTEDISRGMEPNKTKN